MNPLRSRFESTKQRLKRLGSPGQRATALVSFLLERIDDADERAAAERVQALRDRHPEAAADDLVRLLVRRKCRQTAAVGAAAAGAALIPGVGTLAALTLGTAADIGATLKLQAELVLEIAAAHGHEVPPTEKRRIVLLVTGLTAGGNELIARGSRRLTIRLTERYAQRWLEHALPVLGLAAAAGTNVLSTYVIGRRAHAYFGRGPEAMEDWKENLRAFAGVDERRLRAALAERARRSWTSVRESPTLAGALRRVRAVRRRGSAVRSPQSRVDSPTDCGLRTSDSELLDYNGTPPAEAGLPATGEAIGERP